MRQEQQSLTPAQNTTDFKISFQMTNAGARHACSVTIRAVTETDATMIFRENWLTIEKLTRQRLTGQDVGLETLLPAPVRLLRPVQPNRKRRDRRPPPASHDAADLRKVSSAAPAAAIAPAAQ
jgi:hypothetical protein